MKTLSVVRKRLVLILTMFSMAFLMQTTVPVMAIDFEIGTQFGSTLFILDNGGYNTAIAYTRLPAGAFVDVSTTPTALYATGFFGEHFALGTAFSLGDVSVYDESWDADDISSITTLHLAGRAAFFPLSYAAAVSPYVFGRISPNILGGGDNFFFDDDELSMISIGGGGGVQWRIGSAFVLRTEAQYQRVFVEDADEGANEFSLIIGIGTRFENVF